MDNAGLLELSRRMRLSARQVLDDLRIENICREVEATLHVVGSLKTDLMLNHRDIDLHLYTGDPMVEKSFSFMKRVAENQAVKTIQYKNLLDTREECLEWHAWYENRDKTIWKLDIIHIRKGSLYDGFMEKVSDKIIAKLTPASREAILRIKYELGESGTVQGIQIYQAVLEQGITNYADFVRWQKENPLTDVLEWMP